ncbi:MAG: hypothetical protein HWE23_13585 [Rhodobacteraceae bacterium]|nr:hypothetical protein [Paracoccaceae bacterium]
MTFRLLPLLAISAGALLALKLLGLVMGTGITMAPVEVAFAQNAEEVAEDGGLPISGDPATDGPPPDPATMELGGSSAERAVLESLGKRRRSLEAQEGQLDLREKLLQATEDRIQKRVDELKKLEERIEGIADVKQEKEDTELAALVTMYENMKPKDAARIFNRLDLRVLLKVVRSMKPRKMADILGKMDPAAAENLTVAIASGVPLTLRPQNEESDELPKIQSN